MFPLSQENCDFFYNSKTEILEGLKQTTHLGVGAHPDDLEVMAGHGIEASLTNPKSYFSGVTSTSGSGSARSGRFATMTDGEMVEERKKEQLVAAKEGNYLSQFQLGFASGDIKDCWNQSFLTDLKEIIKATEPEFIYTHNLADRHHTHVAVTLHVLLALQELSYRPRALYGCEVWRGLDWMEENQKVLLPIHDPKKIGELISCHASQVEGGKDYVSATLGRMKANATFNDAHSVDVVEHGVWAMDLLPFLEMPISEWKKYLLTFEKAFQKSLEKPFSFL